MTSFSRAEAPFRLSVVSPVYRGEDQVFELVRRIAMACEELTNDYEIILVEDCSPDASWRAIRQAAESFSQVKGLRLSRNFGQHCAITAGLQHATGDWTVVLDCDLQDQPEEIPRLYHEAVSKGFDLVLARRASRQDSLVRRISSRVFYGVFSFLTDTDQDATVANYGIYHKQVIDAILEMGDSVRFFPTMSQWVGFERGYLAVSHAPRSSGDSTYTMRTLLNLAANNIVAFSNKPLRLTVGLGSFISSFSFVVAIFYLVRYLRGEIEVMGYTSLILSVWFMGGIIIALIGVVGIYVGYTFERVKGRPLYIVRERINF